MKNLIKVFETYESYLRNESLPYAKVTVLGWCVGLNVSLSWMEWVTLPKIKIKKSPEQEVWLPTTF